MKQYDIIVVGTGGATIVADAAIKTGKNINVTPSPDEELTAGSILVIIGQNTSITAITSGNKGIIRRR